MFHRRLPVLPIFSVLFALKLLELALLELLETTRLIVLGGFSENGRTSGETGQTRPRLLGIFPESSESENISSLISVNIVFQWRLGLKVAFT